mgnify:FL=1
MTLQEFFGDHPKAALAFSGGVDSSYLLYAARQLGADVKAYYVKTAFQPEFEYQDALRLASQLGADIQVLTLDVLACPDVTVNPKNRCYFCKQHIFGSILRQAKADGYDTVLDGTNASDQVSDRPGMKALQEMKVLSPLRLTGLTKAEIRRLSQEAGLFTWDKPSYACLATRIPTGTEITGADLVRTEWAEDHLMSLGFRDLRVRQLGGDLALVQLPEAQMDTFLALRGEITRTLKTRYAGVLLDMEARNGQ